MRRCSVHCTKINTGNTTDNSKANPIRPFVSRFIALLLYSLFELKFTHIIADSEYSKNTGVKVL